MLNKALTECDSFSFVWRDELDYNENAIKFDEKLKPFLIKEYRTDKWPGTQLDCKSAVIKIYNLSAESIKCLENATTQYDFVSPFYPEDLAFYKKNNVVYASSAHEKKDWYY